MSAHREVLCTWCGRPAGGLTRVATDLRSRSLCLDCWRTQRTDDERDEGRFFSGRSLRRRELARAMGEKPGTDTVERED